MPFGSFGFGPTVPGREFEAREHTETTRPERGRRFARVRRGGSESGAGGSPESEIYICGSEVVQACRQIHQVEYMITDYRPSAAVMTNHH